MHPDKPIRILLAEDHTLVRAGIRSLLSRLDGMEVIGEASDGQEAVKMARRENPDLVVMDIAMAGLNGLEATRRIKNDTPNACVLILSMHANEQYVYQALQAGASGYLLKDAATEELELAIQAALRGQTYLSPRISRQLVEDSLRRDQSRRPAHAAPARDPPARCRGPVHPQDRRTAERQRQDRRNPPRPAHGPPRHPRRARPGAVRYSHRSDFRRRVGNRTRTWMCGASEASESGAETAFSFRVPVIVTGVRFTGVNPCCGSLFALSRKAFRRPRRIPDRSRSRTALSRRHFGHHVEIEVAVSRKVFRIPRKVDFVSLSGTRMIGGNGLPPYSPRKNPGYLSESISATSAISRPLPLPECPI